LLWLLLGDNRDYLNLLRPIGLEDAWPSIWRFVHLHSSILIVAGVIINGGFLFLLVRAPGIRRAMAALTHELAKKMRDFLIGFFGWWIINLVVFGIIIGNSAGEGFWYFILFIGYPITFVANVITLIVLASRRRFVAFGALSATALNLLISLVSGIFINGICFIPFFMDI
jgi:hypothetical protein